MSAISFPLIFLPKKQMKIICPLGSLFGSEYIPIISSNIMLRPVSSFVSLIAADSTVSPYSTKPPGKAHDPLYGGFLRFISITDLLWIITISTVKRGFLI